jgi:hypothetical protein
LDVEAPLAWRLLTHEELTRWEQCCERIDGYRRRWLAEICFRILKSGCRVEALQLGTRERLERALALYLIVAWRILSLVTLGRECPELSCEGVLAPEEWQAAWIVARCERPLSTPPTWGQMTRIVAGFGGFLGRKGDGHPGQGCSMLAESLNIIGLDDSATLAFRGSQPLDRFPNGPRKPFNLAS